MVNKKRATRFKSRKLSPIPVFNERSDNSIESSSAPSTSIRNQSSIRSPININEKNEIVFVTTSTITTTVRGILDLHPEVGILKLRLVKPFPKKSVLEALKPLSDNAVIVNIERNFLGGREGALMQEMKRALYGERYFKMYDIYAGMGGKDVSPITIENMIDKVRSNPDEIIWIDFE